MKAFFKSEYDQLDDGQLRIRIEFAFGVDRYKDVQLFDDAFTASLYVLGSKRDWIASVFCKMMKKAEIGHLETPILQLTRRRVMRHLNKNLADLPVAILKEKEEIDSVLRLRNSRSFRELPVEFEILTKYCENLYEEVKRTAKHFRAPAA